MLSKIVYLNGPSISGKSTLGLKLTSFLINLGKEVSNVSFESLYNTINSDYEDNFYKYVQCKVGISDVVIAESVLFHSYNAYKSLHIVCFPDFKNHAEWVETYREKFGEEELKRRIYFHNTKALRADFMRKYIKYNKSYLVCDMTEESIEDIKKAVLHYVNN